jgi:hypothetical protein
VVWSCRQCKKNIGEINEDMESRIDIWRGNTGRSKDHERDIPRRQSVTLLFVLTLIPMTMVLNATRTGYQLGKNRGNINHLKLYAKNVKELDSLVQTVRGISDDIGMEFGIQKCAMVVIR